MFTIQKTVRRETDERTINQMIKVYDDLLDKEKFDNIKGHIMGEQFPWYLGIVRIPGNWNDESLHDPLDNIQFSNWMYDNHQPLGPEIEIVEPILTHPVLALTSLVRVKANLTMRTSKVVEHGWHVDGFFRCNAAIYYVNSNDGYTKFKDGTKVESVENRLVTFNAQDLHTGTTCTNQKVRCVLNFNYFSKTEEDKKIKDQIITNEEIYERSQ